MFLRRNFIQMKNIPYFLIYSLVLCAGCVFSQSISGSIVDNASSEPITFVTIVNLNTNTGTVSDVHGEFTLKGNINSDTLSITYGGYQTQNVIGSAQMFIKLNASTVSVNEVVISTNREHEKRTDVPVAISSINLNTIEDNKPTSIDQVLNQTPGVNMVDLGNEQHTMSIRRPIDYGASYLYLEDGIPIRTSGVFNHNALLEINMANVNKIEIIRGPASSMYGSEAIGGAINFISKKPSITASAGLSAQGNNLGYKRTDFYASNTFKKKLGIRLSGYYADQKNGTLGHSDFNKLALSLSANYYINKKTGLSWNTSFVDYYSDMSGSLDSTDFFEKSYESDQTFTFRKVNAFRTKLALNHTWNDHSKTNLTGYFRNNSIQQNPAYRVKDDYKPWTGQGDLNLAHGELNDNSFASYGIVTQHKQSFKFWNASVILGASFDYSPNTYNASYISIFKDNSGAYQSFSETDSLLADYHADLVNLAGYTQVKLEPLKNLKVIAALRFDNFNYLFDNNLGINSFTSVVDGKNIFTRFTPKIGATYDFKKNKGAYANFSQGFFPPQVTTLYVGNDIPSLKPVYYDSYEVGGWLSLFKKKAKLEMSIYQMNGINEVISVLQIDGSTIQENAGKTIHKGIEYAINASVHKDVVLMFSGTNAIHEFTEYVASGNDFSGKKMPQSPNWIANTQVTYKPSYLKGFRVSLEWRHVAEYYMDQSNTKSYEGYDVFNVRLGYKRKSIEIWTNILNVADELYATVARSNAWGQTYSLGNPRNINVGLAYKFQQKRK